MKNFLKYFLMLILFLSCFQTQFLSAETKVNAGILKNAVYPFEDSGFLVNRKVIQLKPLKSVAHHQE
jgi:hypothetical protein